MAGKGRGYFGHSREHGLHRKGISTKIDEHRRFAVNNYVARGELTKINKLDNKYRLLNKNYDDIGMKIKNINEKHTKRLEDGLFDLGFSKDEISDMQIDAFVRIRTFEMISSFNLSFSPFDTPELSEWIEERIKEKPNADLIDKLDRREEMWLHKEVSTLFMGEIRDSLENTTADVEEELMDTGYTKDMISDMAIDDWQLGIFFEKVDETLKTQKLMPFDIPLSEWFDDIVGSEKFKASGKDSFDWHNMSFSEKSKLVKESNLHPRVAIKELGVLTPNEISAMKNSIRLRKEVGDY